MSTLKFTFLKILNNSYFFIEFIICWVIVIEFFLNLETKFSLIIWIYL